MGVAVEIRALHKRFPSGDSVITVLDGVDLTLRSGEAVSITGESGSGKSTLLGLLAGLDTPQAGSILVAGRDITRLNDRALTEYRLGSVGLVFQFHHLLEDFSALENVMLPARIAGIGEADARRRAVTLVEQVGLGDRGDHMPAQLSGGERQRIAVARALINAPPLLLADEPTGNLDERNSRRTAETLFELVRIHATSLVLVTHDRTLAARSDRVLELEHGCLHER